MRSLRKTGVLIVGVLVLSLVGDSVFGEQVLTLYGNAASPTLFVADDGRFYHISDRRIGKQILMVSDIWASKVKVIGTVNRQNGRWVMDVTEYERKSFGYCYPGSCFHTRSDTPVRLN